MPDVAEERSRLLKVALSSPAGHDRIRPHIEFVRRLTDPPVGPLRAQRRMLELLCA